MASPSLVRPAWSCSWHRPRAFPDERAGFWFVWQLPSLAEERGKRDDSMYNRIFILDGAYDCSKPATTLKWTCTYFDFRKGDSHELDIAEHLNKSNQGPTMESDQPAGYFSIFSLDPSRSTRETQSRPQRRNRRVFVCIPCHRRKLKCDKGQPCGRCVLSDTPEECVYQQPPAGARRDPSADSRGAPRQSAQSSPRIAAASVGSEAKPRLEGVTHWRSIAFEVRF